MEDVKIKVSKEIATLAINYHMNLKSDDYGISQLYSKLLLSATNIGAYVMKARFALNETDYITEINIALKEAIEARYWLEHLHNNQLVSNDFYFDMFMWIDTIIHLLYPITKKINEIGIH